MTTVLVLVFLVAGFDEEIAFRRFDEAMVLAVSDSLRAEVFLAAADYAAAAHLMTAVHGRSGSPGSLARLWTAILGALNGPDEALAELMEEELRSLDQEADASETEDLYDIALLLGNDVLAESLAQSVYEKWPGSQEALEMLSGEFWNCQGPVWEDDTARVAVLRRFIDERGAISPDWRSRAWQYLVSAVLETADSASWRREIDLWIESCPGDPLPFLTGAALAIDRDSAWAEASGFARDGISILIRGWSPAGLPEQERALTTPAVYSELAFRGAQGLMEMGRPAEASELIEPYLSRPGYFDLNDHHTLAAIWWLEGRLRTLRNSFDPQQAFLRSAELGDTVDRWASLSGKELESSWGPAWLDSARALEGFTGPVFSDVTSLLSDSGPIPAGRIAWGDLDGDCWTDLLAGGRLYRNDHGEGFTDITMQTGLDSLEASEWVIGDLDGDSDLDLACSGPSPGIALNDGGVFRDAGCGMGVIPYATPVEGVGLADWNADGWLDIYFACYEEPGSLGDGTPDRFFIGGPEGFVESTESAGMIPFDDIPLCGRGVSPCDFDRDGDIDIFVSNYRLQENFLWENRDGSAFPSGLGAGIAGHEKNGLWGHTIGSAWADFDNDGDWDLFSANLAHPRYIDLSDRSELLVNNGGVFTDERAVRGIRYEETHSVPVWGDWNNDGLQDLYITSVYENRRSFLYEQLPDGSFRDVTLLSGSRVFNGWGAAAADFDHDGRLDLAVGSGSGMRLFRNVTEGGHWLLVAVEPPEGVNASGIGCIVEIIQDGVSRIRQVSGGSGTTCQDDAVLHFGLPDDSPVTWRLYAPGSAEQVAEGGFEAADRLVSVP